MSDYEGYEMYEDDGESMALTQRLFDAMRPVGGGVAANRRRGDKKVILVHFDNGDVPLIEYTHEEAELICNFLETANRAKAAEDEAVRRANRNRRIDLYGLKRPLRAVKWDGSESALGAIREIAREYEVEYEVERQGDALTITTKADSREHLVPLGDYVVYMSGIQVAAGDVFDEFYAELGR